MTIMTTLTQGWTREARDALPDDGFRRELLDGVLLVSAAPSPAHQSVLAELYTVLRLACGRHADDDLAVLFAPLDVTLAPDTVLQPDLLVARRAAFDDRGLPGPPLLAVEVLSPGSRGIDALLKFERYQRAKVPSYWIVDPAGPSIDVFELSEGTYRRTATVDGDDSSTVDAPVAVTLTPAAWRR